MSMADLVPLSVERRNYVLEWRAADEDDGHVEVYAYVVMKRVGGVLLALPVGSIPDEDLEGPETGLVGPSTVVSVPGVLLQEDQEVGIGFSMDVLLVDMSAGVAEHMRPAGDDELMALTFAQDDPYACPDLEILQQVAMSWIQDNQGNMSSEWFSADTEEERQASPTTRKPRRKGPVQGSPTDPGGQKPKRPTTASLQASVDQILMTLPNLSNQMQSMMERQTALQAQVASSSSTAKVLAQPLSGQISGSQLMSQVAKSIPAPPRSYTQQMPSQVLPNSSKPVALQELEAVRDPDQTNLAQAMMAQSTAVTALVAQLAGASQDPMTDLQLSGMSGSKGAAGRAKLQTELALHRGSFFDAVVKSMARRMAPTASAERGHQELLAAGVSGTRYLERFGGYGRQKELGIIMHQIMTAVDFLMSENYGAAKDCIGLTAVMLEQACLDGGRFELAQILTMQEDVPASVFTNRQLAMSSRSRAFSPLADQKWITTSIAFLKELDTISTKRSELMSGQGLGSFGGTPPGGDNAPKAKPSPKKKGKGRGGRSSGQAAEEEENL